MDDTERENGHDILDLRGAAAYLRVSAMTLYRVLESAACELPAQKVGGQWRLRRSALDRYLSRDWDKRHGAGEGSSRGPKHLV